MRLIVPRRGRGRGLGRLAVGLALLALGIGSCGGEDEPTAEQPKKTPRPATRVVETGGALAVGITEPNPNFFKSGDVPEPFGRYRDALVELRPALYRFTVDWASLQPERGGPLQADQPHTGCMRDIQPCAGWNGLREQLRALAQRQKDTPDAWQALVVVYGTPEWAAAPASACERAGTEARNRPPADLEAYGQFVRAVLRLAEQEGAQLRYWSPWNEPNHPYFIASQRTRCDADAPSAATKPYARLARAMAAALGEEQELVLGEMAGLTERKSSYTGVGEFAERLPRDVVCSASVWGQHLYIGGEDAVEQLLPALAGKNCDKTHEIWITETGVEGSDGCRKLRKALLRWYEDPRVTAAIQYTLREDDAYPVGLVSTDLSEPFAALKEWQAWGTARRPDPADPPPESQCSG